MKGFQAHWHMFEGGNTLVIGTQNPPQVINLRLSRALRHPAPSVPPDSAQPAIPQSCHHSDIMFFGRFPFTVLPVVTGLCSAVPTLRTYFSGIYPALPSFRF